MRRLVFLCLALAALPGCSLTEDAEPPLRMLWESEQPAEAPSVQAATDTERLYTIRGRTGDVRQLRALDRRTGALVWSSPVRSSCSPPVVRDGRVYCPAQGVQTYDAASGRALWSVRPDEYFGLAPGAADGQRLYVSRWDFDTITSAVLALDPSTGDVLWERAFETEEQPGVAVKGLVVSPEGDLLVSFDAEYDPPTIFSAAVIVGLDPATGEERWRYTDGDRTTNRDIGGLTIWENLVLYSSPTGQRAVAVDRATREVMWTAAYTPGSFSGLRPPLVKDGVAHFTDTLGGIFAVDARTGRARWSRAESGGYFSHEVCGRVVFGDNLIGDVFDRVSGRPLGPLLEPDDIPQQTAVADDVLYISSDRGVSAFDCTE